MSGCADAKGDAQHECAHCGRSDGTVYEVNDFRHGDPLSPPPGGMPTVHLHDRCLPKFFGRATTAPPATEAAERVCIHCGRPGGNPVAYGEDTVRLHPGCERAFIDRREG